MLRCRNCFKSYYELDAGGLCKRCAAKAQKNKVTLTVEPIDALKSIPYRQNGMILTKERWFAIKRSVDAFFNSISAEEIDAQNEQTKRLRAAISGQADGTVGHIYLLKSSTGHYKIGRTIDIEKRLKAHLRDYPVELRVIHTIPTGDTITAERVLLDTFADKRSQGEWFNLSSDDVAWIMTLDSESLTELVRVYRLAIAGRATHRHVSRIQE